MRSVNKEVLFLYTENPRIKLKDISRQLEKSSPRLKYTLNQMLRERIVYQPHAVIDYSFFGLLLFRVYFKGGYASEKDKETILQKLAEHPFIVSVAEMGGEFDLVIELQAPNPSRFNKELKKLVADVPTLRTYKVVLNVVTHLYSRGYLPEQEWRKKLSRSEDIVIGGDRQVDEFTPAEMKIVALLLESATQRVATLARRGGMNIKTATQILKSLEKRRAIKAYQALIDTSALGIHKHRLFLKLRNISPEKEQELLAFFLKTDEVVQVHKTIGDWDLEADLEAWDRSRIRYLIIALREEFADVIESFNSMEFYHTHSKAYLPRAVVAPVSTEKSPAPSSVQSLF